MSKKELTNSQANVLSLYKKDNDVVNDSNRLCAAYWVLFDKLDYHAHANPYEMLKAVTPTDTIKRSRRWLHEHGYIEYSDEVEKETEEQYKEHTEQYSNQDVFKQMREKLNKKEG